MRDDDVIVDVDEEAEAQRQNGNEGDVQINESSFGTSVGHVGHTSRFNGESPLGNERLGLGGAGSLWMPAPRGHYHLKGAPIDETRATTVAMAAAIRTGVCLIVVTITTSSARRR